MHSSLRFSACALAVVVLSGCVAAQSLVSLPAFPMPLDRMANRPAALRFGMHVTTNPEENPIDPPERFAGYHVGLDYEVFDDELDADVPAYAICSGEVALAGFVDGYGGLLVQHCTLNGEAVTVLYGHLDGARLPEKGATLNIGERVGYLAPPRSKWSDGNRKHLHLGIHRGDILNERGYVQTEAEIGDFIDPRSVLPHEAWGRDVEKFHVPDTTASSATP